MKQKLFSIFCCLLLSAGMVVQAQVLPQAEELSEQGVQSLLDIDISHEILDVDAVENTNNISERRNAPQQDYTLNFRWEDEAFSIGSGDRYTFLGPKYYGQNVRDMFYVRQISIAQGYKSNNNVNTNNPAITLYLTYSNSNGLTDYGAATYPSVGTYTVGTSSSAGSAAVKQIVDYGNLSASQECTGYNRWSQCTGYVYYNCFMNDAGTQLYYNNTSLNSKIWASSVNNGSKTFSGGSITFEGGRHGLPYVYSTNLRSSSDRYTITIGDSRALTATYTSCRVATDEENGKAVLQAYDGINTMTLVFNVDNIENNAAYIRQIINVNYFVSGCIKRF